MRLASWDDQSARWWSRVNIDVSRSAVWGKRSESGVCAVPALVVYARGRVRFTAPALLGGISHLAAVAPGRCKLVVADESASRKVVDRYCSLPYYVSLRKSVACKFPSCFPAFACSWLITSSSHAARCLLLPRHVALLV